MPNGSRTITLAGEDGQPPFTVTATVVTVERRSEPSPLAGVRLGLYAQLDVTVAPDTQPRSYSYFLSRLVGETTWIIDALFGPNGYPHFIHGFGARYLQLRVLAVTLADLLDEQARDRGLVQTTGRDVPLILAEPTTAPAVDEHDRP